jgi:hypothetical protein
MAPPTYGKTWWREGYACGCMIIMIEEVIEPRLRDAGYLGAAETVNMFQQAYNSSVSASAGTHGGGGSLDHQKGSDGETKIWRECGVASWQRGSPEDNAFDDHNHGIWQGCPHLSGDAASQVDQYEAGCNGLADWGVDQSPSVPPISWQAAYDKYIDDLGGGGGDEELFGMTNRISKYRGKSQSFQEDNWDHTIAINDEGHATIATNTKGMVDVVLAITGGLAAGEEIGVRWQYIGTKGDSSNVDWASQPIDLRSNGGTDRFQIVHHFDLKPAENGWDHKLRLAINTGGKKVSLGTVEAKGWED